MRVAGFLGCDLLAHGIIVYNEHDVAIQFVSQKNAWPIAPICSKGSAGRYAAARGSELRAPTTRRRRPTPARRRTASRLTTVSVSGR